MNGWMGKLLRVNLTRGSASVEELPRGLARLYLGGRGLATRILYDEMDAELDALSPDDKMVFMTGPLTGTGALGGASYVVVTKSPLSGSIACSTAEGYFGPELKFAGYDGIILEGRAAEPVYLSIEDEKVELLSASHLWGKSTLKTEELIRREKENCWVAQETSVASIGPAGEKKVRIACVMNDKHRAAGRCGLGAVMGSKNLKAIAAKGTKKVQIANQETFTRVSKKQYDLIRDSMLKVGLETHGTNLRGLPRRGGAARPGAG